MPSLMLRALPPALITHVRTFARDRGLSLPAGAVELLWRGLRASARDQGAEPPEGAQMPEDHPEGT